MENIEMVLGQLYYRLAKLSTSGYVNVIFIANEIEIYRAKTQISKLDFITIIRDCLTATAESTRERVTVSDSGKVYFRCYRGGAIIENIQDYKDGETLERRTIEMIDIWISATFIETDVRTEHSFPVEKRTRLKLGELLNLFDVVNELRCKYESENTTSAPAYSQLELVPAPVSKAQSMDVLVGNMVDLVADMKSYTTSIEYSHKEIEEDCKSQGISVILTKRKEAVLRIIPNGKIEKFHELGDIARQLRGYIKRTGDDVVRERFCSIDLSVMGDFYNFMIGYFQNPDDPEYSFRGVLIAMMEIQEEKNSKTPKQPLQVEEVQVSQIDEIITYEDTVKAKEIIKREMKDKRGKGASIVIRAFVKAKIIRADNIDRVGIYRAIRELVEADIGTDSGINKYWFDSTLEAQVNLIVKRIEQ